MAIAVTIAIGLLALTGGSFGLMVGGLAVAASTALLAARQRMVSAIVLGFCGGLVFALLAFNAPPVHLASVAAVIAVAALACLCIGRSRLLKHPTGWTTTASICGLVVLATALADVAAFRALPLGI